MAKKKPSYESVQVEEGKWYAATSPEPTECCDCSMVHVVEYMMEKGRLFWRVSVDRKQTKALRKRYGIKIVREKVDDVK